MKKNLKSSDQNLDECFSTNKGHNYHKRISSVLQLILVIGLILSLWSMQWLTALSTSAILGLTFWPLFIGKKFSIKIPPEFELLTAIFVFASLFLGEIRGYYVRFWWWDAALHTASGFILGILGFLLVYILNEKEDIDLHMKPEFVALFAFMFSMGLGGIWEIFEFSIDSIFGMNMQKSGLVDTMWDLIVDAVGALTMAILGYGYLKKAGSDSFLEKWISKFIEQNRHLFRKT